MQMDPDDARMDRIDVWYERTDAVQKLRSAEKKHKDELEKIEEENKFLMDTITELTHGQVKLRIEALGLKSKIEALAWKLSKKEKHDGRVQRMVEPPNVDR